MKAFLKIKNIIGILLCIVMIPILSINLAWIIQSYIHPDQIPSIFGYMVFVVTTDSMVPAVEGGSLVVVKETPASQVSEGDIIAFYDPAGGEDSIVTHRILKKEKDAQGGIVLTTKGDANNTEDSEKVPAEKVIGKMEGQIPKIGKVILFSQTTQGVFLLAVVPLLIYVIYLGISTKRAAGHDAVSIKQEKESIT